MKVSAILALWSTAGVIATPMEKIGPLQRRDVSATALSSMELFSQYSAISYCDATYTTTAGQTLTCSSDNCALVEAAKATMSSIFQDDVTGVAGYISVDPQNSLIVLTIRGTVNVRNFVDDILFLYTSCDLVSGCLVHAGFWAAWLESRSTALTGVASAMAANPSYKLVVTGHSLGGAIATLAAAELRKSGTAADLYTFGSPRVGNSVFANFVTNQTGVSVRVTHTDDPVPRLPPLLFSYRHMSTEYWIEEGDYNIPTSEIEVLTGIANTAGNAGQGGFNTTARDYYFGYITACYGSLTFKRDSVGDEPAVMVLDEQYIAALGNTTLAF